MMGKWMLITLSALLVATAGCSEKITPLWVASGCGKEIVAADIYRQGEMLVILTPMNVCTVNPQTGAIYKSQSHAVPMARAIACGSSACWIGGGRHSDGTLSSLVIANDGLLLSSVSKPGAQVNAIAAVSGGGSVTAHSDEAVTVRDATGKAVSTLYVRDGLENEAVTFSEHGIIAGNNVGEVVVWDGKKEELEVRINLGKGAVLALASKKDMVVAGGYGYLSVLKTGDASNQRNFEIQKVAATTCELQESGNIAWCGLSDGSVAKVDLSAGSMDRIELHKEAITFIRVTNSQLVTGSKDGTVKAWEMSSLKNIKRGLAPSNE